MCYITTGGMVPQGADAVVPAALPPPSRRPLPACPLPSPVPCLGWLVTRSARRPVRRQCTRLHNLPAHPDRVPARGSRGGRLGRDSSAWQASAEKKAHATDGSPARMRRAYVGLAGAGWPLTWQVMVEETLRLSPSRGRSSFPASLLSCVSMACASCVPKHWCEGARRERGRTSKWDRLIVRHHTWACARPSRPDAKAGLRIQPLPLNWQQRRRHTREAGGAHERVRVAGGRMKRCKGSRSHAVCRQWRARAARWRAHETMPPHAHTARALHVRTRRALACALLPTSYR